MGSYIKPPKRSAKGTPASNDSPSDVPFVQQAQQLISQQLAGRLAKPAADLEVLATALRMTTQHLSGNFGAPYVEKIADGLGHTAAFLERPDARELATAAQRFARQQPLLFAGAAVAIGIGAGRFLKVPLEPRRGEPRCRGASTTYHPNTKEQS